ncbi:hypothetical protein [Flectobacillus major]|uniref:hypothetical protein n=1 Tax=Flectobacillus major TaxID=103 RepID=UPI0004799C55|nr:hypothetical protein [Flectobacillus major]
MIIIEHKDTKVKDNKTNVSKLYWFVGIISLCCVGSLITNWYQWKERNIVIENLREALIKQDSTLASKLESDKEIARLKRKLIRRSKQLPKSTSTTQLTPTISEPLKK